MQKKKVKKSGVCNSARLPQDTSVLSPGLHIGLILTLAFIIFKKSSSQLFEHHPCLYVLTFGMVIAKISNKLVVSVSHVAGAYMSFILFLNSYPKLGVFRYDLLYRWPTWPRVSFIFRTQPSLVLDSSS